MHIITMYETMSCISAQMVEAARANDWDRLAALELNVAGVRRALEAGEYVGDLTQEQRARKVVLIHRILDDDAEVRRHTEPWMEQVKIFLGAPARERKVRDSYRSGSGR